MTFDEMADDFVQQQVEHVIPYVMTYHERARLRIAYLVGLNLGIEFCRPPMGNELDEILAQRASERSDAEGEGTVP